MLDDDSSSGADGLLPPEAAAENTRVPSRLVLLLIATLCLAAAVFLVWPVYRAFLNVAIDTNEGWNAYFADAAMGRMPLYPHADRLITNNYPPLSFFIVGGAGRLLGDPVLAGRLISLCAILVVASAIAAAVRPLGGNRLGAVLGAALFVAIMGRFCTRYAGMNDPQLLAHAVMACGFAAFTRAAVRGRGYLAPILLMVAAGFIKHNIIAMPFSALAWLAVRRPREAAKCSLVALAAIGAGFLACYTAFGRDFFTNMFCPRLYSWSRAWAALPDLKRLDVPLVAALCVGWMQRRDPRVQLCTLLVLVSLASWFLQKTGAGVDINAELDLVIALSLATALAFTWVPLWRVPQPFGPEALRILLLVMLCARMLPWKGAGSLETVRLCFDPKFRAEIASREKAMDETMARIRATPGDVMSSNLACYRAGKPFAIDLFNARQRMLAGSLPPNAVNDRLRNHTLTVVDAAPLAEWKKP